MATLTKKEIAWLNNLQAVLDRCPSPEKIGFYTTGGSNIHLYDLRKYKEVLKALDTGRAPTGLRHVMWQERILRGRLISRLQLKAPQGKD